MNALNATSAPSNANLLGYGSAVAAGSNSQGVPIRPATKLGQVAERAARAGVASSAVAELKAEKARQMEAEAKAKTAKRRRRKAKEEKEPDKTTEEKSE